MGQEARVTVHRQRILILAICTAFLCTAAKPGSGFTPVGNFFLPGEKPFLSQALLDSTPIELDLARSEIETVAFSVSVGDPLAPISSVKVNWEGGVTPGIDLHPYWMGVQRFSKSSFRMRPPAGEVPEILAPNSWIALKAIRPPAENVASNPLYLIEISARGDAVPGTFKGALEVEVGGRKFSHSIRVQIFHYRIPDRLDLASSFGFSPWAVLKKHYGAWNAAELSLYRKYIDLALEHRVDLHKLYIKFPDAGASDPLADGANPAQSFLGQTQEFFDHGGTGGVKLGITDLPVPEERKAARKQDEPFWRSLDASVVAHGLEKRSFVYFKDEPTPADLPLMATNLKKIRAWAPHLHFLVTHHYREVLDGAVNLWCVNLFVWEQSGEPTADFYLQRQKKNDEPLWIYVGCNSHGCSGAEDPGNPDLVTDRPSAYARALPWVAVRFGATGVLYFDSTYGYDHGDAKSPWTDSFQFTGYGEGNLFYPCTPALGGCVEPKVLPSYRLKIFRSGMQDAQILLAAKAAGAPVDTWMKALIPNVRQIPHSVLAMAKVKRQALMALEGGQNQPVATPSNQASSIGIQK